MTLKSQEGGGRGRGPVLQLLLQDMAHTDEHNEVVEGRDMGPGGTAQDITHNDGGVMYLINYYHYYYFCYYS